ncbi:MAG TPA: hypothetical protein VLT45_02235 [Kofleriaceae bacterium]|nr:hypothetical protein [Kofleriaceae bacterium]
MQAARLSKLMTLTCGGERPASRAEESMLSILAIAAALALASLWGMAAGSESGALMVANAYKVPMVILLSALTALPAGIVALRLSNARLGGAELAGAFATSIFGGTLVLATLAPLVAIYYHTSSKAGLPLALGSVFVALATASLLFARAVARRVSDRKSLFAVVVLVVIFLAALLQFVALAAPIIGSHGTAFDGGFDRVF